MDFLSKTNQGAKNPCCCWRSHKITATASLVLKKSGVYEKNSKKHNMDNFVTHKRFFSAPVCHLVIRLCSYLWMFLLGVFCLNYSYVQIARTLLMLDNRNRIKKWQVRCDFGGYESKSLFYPKNLFINIRECKKRISVRIKPFLANSGACKTWIDSLHVPLMGKKWVMSHFDPFTVKKWVERCF